MPNANATLPSLPLRWRVGRAAALTVGLGLFALLLGAGNVPCGFARMTHLPCPGCGSTRAVWALAHGDLAEMLRYNFLGPLMAVLVGALAVDVLASIVRTGSVMQVGDGRYARHLPRAVLVVAILEIVLWGVRFAGFLGGPVPV